MAVAFIGYCLSWLAGGELGIFGLTGPTPWMFALEGAAWLIVPSLVMMLWAARAGSQVVEDVVDATPRSEAKTASDKEKTDSATLSKPAKKKEQEAKSASAKKGGGVKKDEGTASGMARKVSKGDEAGEVSGDETGDEPNDEAGEELGEVSGEQVAEETDEAATAEVDDKRNSGKEE